MESAAISHCGEREREREGEREGGGQSSRVSYLTSLTTDRDMLAYNIRSDETTVLADGKEKQSLYSLFLCISDV